MATAALATMSNLYLTGTVAHIETPEQRTESHLALKRLMVSLVAQLAPKLVLEIGARQADFTFDLCGALPETRFVCLEANPHSHARYAPRFAGASNVEYLHAAASDHEGSLTLRIPKGDDPSNVTKGNASLLERTHYEKGYLEERVRCLALDSLLPAEGKPPRIAAWIDVEGAFHIVYDGARRTLEQMDVLMIEVEERRFWHDQWLASDVFEQLASHDLVAIARDAEYARQYNVVFVRKSRLDAVKLELIAFLRALRSL